MSNRKRKEVVFSIQDAAARIESGMTIAIGGFGADNHPMTLVREIIRNGTKDLTVIASATAGLEIDLLIGAGCVRKLIAPYVGQEMYCPIGHNFRKYAEEGKLEIWECSEYILYGGFFAAASGSEFFAWRGGVGTSIPELNKDIVEFTDPIGGKKKILAVPPLRPDWSIIHVGWADCYGNGQHLGARFGDRWIARAAARIMVQAERIVPNSVIRRNPFMTTIAYADCVVEAPYGGHPYAAHGFYKEDVDFIQDYVKSSEANRKGDSKTWEEYLDRHVHRPKDHVEYLETVGIRKLLDLYTHPIVNW
ncbi:CoA transferase subunit A [Pseudochelatococcus sp. B33]